jgi:hypothetical protein
MPDIQLAVPLANQTVAQPFTVILTWDIPQLIVAEAQKRYAEAMKITDDAPLPFIARLSADGLTQWYNWYFDGSGPFTHRWLGINGTVGMSLLYFELRQAPANNATPGDPESYTLLASHQVYVIIV